MNRRSFLGWLGLSAFSLPILNKLPMIEDTHHVIDAREGSVTITLPQGNNGQVLRVTGEGFLFWDQPVVETAALFSDGENCFRVPISGWKE
jgi:hypothetical protein